MSQELQPDPTPDGPPNGVLVVKVIDENGGIGVSIAPTGDVQVTEVLTLLSLALNATKGHLGIA